MSNNTDKTTTASKSTVSEDKAPLETFGETTTQVWRDYAATLSWVDDSKLSKSATIQDIKDLINASLEDKPASDG